MAGRWLLKTEPSCYSLAQLRQEKRAVWDGVRNAVALKHLRSIEKGDLCFIYHTGDEKAVVGIAKAVSDAYADPNDGDPKAAVVDLAFVGALPRPVPLAAIKAYQPFADWELVRLPRLSVLPVSLAQWEQIEAMAQR
ncbi:MAG TPA: EVE domain-containing protein [Terriglobales bacterium]|nr:EVE domain-containing protein [Terriglobales bacterium]